MHIVWIYRGFLDFLFPNNQFEKSLRAMNPTSYAQNSTPCLYPPPTISVLYSYQHPLVKKTIKALKYRKNKDAARIFGYLLYDTLLTDTSERALFETANKPIIIPMPSSKSRLGERGYNQVKLITDAIQSIDTEATFLYEPQALKRIKDSESQTHLKSKRERIKNLTDAFYADPSIVSKKTIILIDDVTTTGTTMKEARKALKLAGAKKIYCYAIAH